jgi:hypothetical protein
MAFDFDYLVGKVLNIDDFTAKVEILTPIYIEENNVFAHLQHPFTPERTIRDP